MPFLTVLLHPVLAPPLTAYRIASADRFTSLTAALPTTLCFAVCDQQSRLAEQVRGLRTWTCGCDAMNMRARSVVSWVMCGRWTWTWRSGVYSGDVAEHLQRRRLFGDRASTAETSQSIYSGDACSRCWVPHSERLHASSRPLKPIPYARPTSAAETSTSSGRPHSERPCIRASDACSVSGAVSRRARERGWSFHVAMGRLCT